MYESLNEKTRQWRFATRRKIVEKMKELGIKHVKRSPSSKAASKSVSTREKKKFGVVERISYTFPKHMVFVHHGVGRGTKRNAANSFHTNRVPKDWFNSVLDEEVPRLADDITDEFADMSVNAIQIK